MMERKDFSLLAMPMALMSCVGLALACPLIALQGANPAQHILTQTQYRAYYPFYALGPHLLTLSWMGLVGAALALILLGLWCLDRFQVRLLPQRLHLARLILLGAQSWWLLLLITVGWFLWVTTGSLCHPEAPLWSALLGLPPILSVLCLLVLAGLGWRWGAWAELRGLSESWSGGAGAAVLAVALSLLSWMGVWMLLPDPLELAQGARFHSFLLPPFMWTQFGPWGILAWQMAAGAGIGLALGIGMCGLTPDEAGGEVPLHRRGLAAAATVVALLTLLGGRSLLAQRYQIGLDLRTVLGLQLEPEEGRVVVWLDRPRPAQSSGPVKTYLSPANLQRVSVWLEQAPVPSAQTRCALAALGNRALWDWDPDRALQSLALQRERQIHNSQVNTLMVQVLQTGAPTPARQALVEEFTRPGRFAWPGPEPLAQVGNLLARWGHGLKARSWLDQASELDGQQRRLPQPPSARISGRLLLQGRPLGGARVALFRGSDESVRKLVDQEVGLLRSELLWTPRNRPSMSLPHLRAFYAVCATGEDGRFILPHLDPGSYWALARIPRHSDLRVEGGSGQILLEPGTQLDLGDVRLAQP